MTLRVAAIADLDDVNRVSPDAVAHHLGDLFVRPQQAFDEQQIGPKLLAALPLRVNLL